MHAVADTRALVADEVITEAQAREIEARSRKALMALAINTVLMLGILMATFGLIVALASPGAVAFFGALMLAAGLGILSGERTDKRLFGNAAALIGAGMLCGGLAIELLDNPRAFGPAMLLLGAAVLGASAVGYLRDAFGARFLLGAFCVLGLGLHLWGGGFALQYQEIGGWPVALFYLYAAALMFCTGWLIDVRLISALAILPFAQMLDTGGFYFDAVYAFYSPEPTLSVLQMGLLLVACLWVARHVADRTARHARIVAVLAFVVLNLCALVGSIFGDVVGATIWGPEYPRFSSGEDWASRREAIAAWRDAYDAFAARAFVISEGVFSLLWGGGAGGDPVPGRAGREPRAVPHCTRVRCDSCLHAAFRKLR